MAHDPIVSLRPCPVTVNLGGMDYTIRALTAADWLEVLLAHQGGVVTWNIVPGLLGEDDQEDVVDRLMDGEIELEELREVALEALTIAGGNPWWWTLRIVGLATQMWEKLFGLVLLGGVDPSRVSLAAYTFAIYALCTKDLPQEKQQVFDMDLNQVPEGVEVELDEDAESAAFMRMMQQTQQLPY